VGGRLRGIGWQKAKNPLRINKQKKGKKGGGYEGDIRSSKLGKEKRRRWENGVLGLENVGICCGGGGL